MNQTCGNCYSTKDYDPELQKCRRCGWTPKKIPVFGCEPERGSLRFGRIINFIQDVFAGMRYRATGKHIIGSSIDIGSGMMSGYHDSGGHFEDVSDLKFKDNSFDTVLCQEVLEHIADPVRGMKELWRVAKKRVIITVPLEPNFTLLRLPWGWCKPHRWAIMPSALKHHLGEPMHEQRLYFRWYMGVWSKT
ncbi:MAG: class I SAM-dependent methyltransferase [Candidatus Aenigmatarchaeota archaeon]|nr:MAG: class I SAM-dependent methyltransferase [Candidatus Aenigmarchaeota archaeon]